MDGVGKDHGLDWQARARCAGMDDPDLFFPDRRDLPAAALAICEGCPVLQECRHHALTRPERYGIWGGLTEAERERLLRASQRERSTSRPSTWVGVTRRVGA